MADRLPLAPAIAYMLVAPLLPPAYFTKLPPEDGVLVVVPGEDATVTTWQMSRHLAAQVEASLRGRARVQVTSH